MSDLICRLWQQMELLNQHKDFSESCTLIDLHDAIKQLTAQREQAEQFKKDRENLTDYVGTLLGEKSELKKLNKELVDALKDATAILNQHYPLHRISKFRNLILNAEAMG